MSRQQRRAEARQIQKAIGRIAATTNEIKQAPDLISRQRHSQLVRSLRTNYQRLYDLGFIKKPTKAAILFGQLSLLIKKVKLVSAFISFFKSCRSKINRLVDMHVL